MVGRSIVNTPFQWRSVDSELYPIGVKNEISSFDNAQHSNLEICSRRVILSNYAAYANQVESLQGSRARRALMKPLLGLFTGEKNGKVFRNIIDNLIKDVQMPIGTVFLEAAKCLPEHVLEKN